MKHSFKKFELSIIFKLSALIFSIALAIVILLFAFATYFTSNQASYESHKILFIGLILIVLIIFVVAVFIMHHYLKPIKQLSDGVNEVRKGNLDKIIPVNSKDELGQLANAYNMMTLELKQMIQAREQLLYDVSHELRTPLTNSKLALEMMSDSKERESILEDINEMELMINELLESARLNNANFNIELLDVSVKKIVDSTIIKYYKSNTSIVVNPIDLNISIKADELRIISVIKNLIDNSLKYSNRDNVKVIISVADLGNKINIEIEDFGPGIEPEKLPFVFEPFYKQDSSRSKHIGGYGLGLHLCKKIIEAHNGEITIINKSEKSGIIVRISFNK